MVEDTFSNIAGHDSDLRELQSQLALVISQHEPRGVFTINRLTTGTSI